MSDPTPNLPAEPEQSPDMVAELGALAYALFALNESGPLADVRPLSEAREAHVPTQGGRSLERDLFQEKILGELGALDL